MITVLFFITVLLTLPIHSYVPALTFAQGRYILHNKCFDVCNCNLLCCSFKVTGLNIHLVNVAVGMICVLYTMMVCVCLIDFCTNIMLNYLFIGWYKGRSMDGCDSGIRHGGVDVFRICVRSCTSWRIRDNICSCRGWWTAGRYWVIVYLYITFYLMAMS